MNRPGEAIVALLGTATKTSLIVAPFIRSHALEQILEAVPDGVEVSIVTRWRPVDLLAGASDLGVFDITAARDIPLYLRHDLHAKMFAADRACLIGSANVTDTALGWCEPANLELLSLVDRDAPEIRAFEEELFRVAVRATSAQRDFMQRFIDDLAAVVQQLPRPEVATEELAGSLITPDWIPRSKNPEDLYTVYRGNTDAVGRAGLSDMRTELQQLGVSPGLTEPHFNSWVRATMCQAAVVAAVLTSIDKVGGISELEFADLLESIGITNVDVSPAEILEVLRRWFNHFMLESYETKQDSIRLVRTKQI